MTVEPLDPAAIMYVHSQAPGGFRGCNACEWSEWPCLPYRLAEALIVMGGQVDVGCAEIDRLNIQIAEARRALKFMDVAGVTKALGGEQP